MKRPNPTTSSMVVSLAPIFLGQNLLNDLAYLPIAGHSFGGSLSRYCNGFRELLDLKQLVPVDWSSESHLHIGRLILEVVLGVVGIASIVVVVLNVSSSCVLELLLEILLLLFLFLFW